MLDEQASLPRVLAAIRSDGLEELYAYGPEGLHAQRTITGTTDTISYALLDAQGSLKHLTDSSGALTLTRVYDAWGVVRSTSGSGTSRLGYTGELQDGSLVYLRARWYHTGLGTFTSRDTFQGVPDRPQSLHRYGYAANDPVNRTDHSGHDWLTDAQRGATWMHDRVGLQAMQRSAAFFGKVSHTIGENPTILWQLATHPCVLDSLQETMDIMGIMPVLGMPFDVANAFVSAGRGDYPGTVMRGMFAMPGVGDTMAGMHLTGGMGQRLATHESDKVLDITQWAYANKTTAGELFDAEKLARILVNLEKQGVTLVIGDAAQRQLAANGAQALYLPIEGGPGILFLSTNPTRLQVIEELFHLGQHRRMDWGSTSATPGLWELHEIEAQKWLLNYGTQRQWMQTELDQLTQNLKRWIEEYRKVMHD